MSIATGALFHPTGICMKGCDMLVPLMLNGNFLLFCVCRAEQSSDFVLYYYTCILNTCIYLLAMCDMTVWMNSEGFFRLCNLLGLCDGGSVGSRLCPKWSTACLNSNSGLCVWAVCMSILCCVGFSQVYCFPPRSKDIQFREQSF